MSNIEDHKIVLNFFLPPKKVIEDDRLWEAVRLFGILLFVNISVHVIQVTFAGLEEREWETPGIAEWNTE